MESIKLNFISCSNCSITHSELANSIGSTRSKVTHQLSFFTDAGFIRTSRGAIEIIDLEGLKSYLKKLEEEDVEGSYPVAFLKRQLR